MFLGTQFTGAYEMALRLKEECLFDEIHLFEYKIRKGFRHKYRRIFELLFPRYYGKKYVRGEFLFGDKEVDELYFCVPTHFALLVRWIYPQSRLIYLDDGTGSYSGDMITRLLDKNHRFFYSLLGRKIDSWYPECLYINNIDICKTLLTTNVQELPKLSNSDTIFWNMVTRIFDYTSQKIYTDRKFVLLSQINQYNNHEMKMIDNIIIDILEKYKDMTIVRPHPRDSFVEKKELEVDFSNSMWELVCEDTISEDMVLISRFSTSQLIPKILYNKEPYIIFLYKLYSEILMPDDYERIVELAQVFIDYYTDKSKILIPNDCYEFETCLEKIIGKRVKTVPVEL
ncbi:hypothetical protein [Butyrivibrio sp. LC3010]|uniref:hypothetical protein n=1 Tax=Butyrivibrio sp. LC3010 TaxID=1280680 RepID=UPI000478AEFE|nr:hypothetical protein [Butyrivibrio sp. LC3010]